MEPFCSLLTVCFITWSDATLLNLPGILTENLPEVIFDIFLDEFLRASAGCTDNMLNALSNSNDLTHETW